MATDETPAAQPEADNAAKRRRVTTGAIIGLLVAVIAIGGGLYASRSVGTAPEVATALSANAINLAGTLPPESLKGAECAKTSTDDEYRCVLKSGKELRVVFESGVITKRLSGVKLDRIPESADEVARLIETEQKTIGGSEEEFACGGSIGFNPDGSTDAEIQGYLCVEKGVKKPQSRFLMFAADGSATRDYLVPLDGAANTAPPAG